MSPRSQRPFTFATLSCCLGVCPLGGCMLEKQDDSAEFREAVPSREAIALAGPEADSGADTAAASAKSPARSALAITRPGTNGPYAKWYGFTRAVRGGVNLVTAVVLTSVWAVVHTDPTVVENGEAAWGPYNDALAPVTYRFRVSRIAKSEYDYVLEGRPKASHADGDYQTVLRGHGYGKAHPDHGKGDFSIDLEVARALDPLSHQSDSGTVHVTYELPASNSETGAALPRTVTAEVTPDPNLNRESFTATSRAAVDGSGSLDVVAHADVDDTKLTALEDVVVASRFRRDGAGRADIQISGGDVPAQLPDGSSSVTAVECWGADFMRNYYTDSIDFQPTEGDATACVYAAP